MGQSRSDPNGPFEIRPPSHTQLLSTITKLETEARRLSDMQHVEWGDATKLHLAFLNLLLE